MKRKKAYSLENSTWSVSRKQNRQVYQDKNEKSESEAEKYTQALHEIKNVNAKWNKVLWRFWFGKSVCQKTKKMKV